MLPTELKTTVPKSVLRHVWSVSYLKGIFGMKNENEIREMFDENPEYLEIFKTLNDKLKSTFDDLQIEARNLVIERQKELQKLQYKSLGKRRRRSVSDGLNMTEQFSPDSANDKTEIITTGVSNLVINEKLNNIEFFNDELHHVANPSVAKIAIKKHLERFLLNNPDANDENIMEEQIKYENTFLQF